MKKFSAAFIIASIFLSAGSCKKDDAPVVSRHTITYRITSNNYEPLSNITYKDSTTAPVPSSAVDSTSGWSKSTNAYLPFSAQLQVQGINSSSQELSFTLEIDEDGIMKASKQQTTAPFASFNVQLDANLQ